jgi:hypothetical protein
MRYLFAFLLPPLAIAMCKRWGHFVVNLLFFIASFPMIFVLGIGLVMWLLCIVHALIVCRMSSVDKRVDRLVQAIQARPQPHRTAVRGGFSFGKYLIQNSRELRYFVS